MYICKHANACYHVCLYVCIEHDGLACHGLRQGTSGFYGIRGLSEMLGSSKLPHKSSPWLQGICHRHSGTLSELAPTGICESRALSYVFTREYMRKPCVEKSCVFGNRIGTRHSDSFGQNTQHHHQMSMNHFRTRGFPTPQDSWFQRLFMLRSLEVYRHSLCSVCCLEPWEIERWICALSGSA